MNPWVVIGLVLFGALLRGQPRRQLTQSQPNTDRKEGLMPPADMLTRRLPRDSEEAKDIRDERWRAKWRFRIEGVSLPGAIALLVFTGYQACVYNTELFFANRPMVDLVKAETSISSEGHSDVAVIDASFKNAGPTPAKDVRIALRVQVRPKGKLCPESDNEIPKYGHTVPPGADYGSRQKLTLSKTDLAAINDGSKNIYVWGIINYRSYFEKDLDPNKRGLASIFCRSYGKAERELWNPMPKEPVIMSPCSPEEWPFTDLLEQQYEKCN